MLNIIKRSMLYKDVLNMIYMDDSGQITKRRVKVFRLKGKSFQAYCYLRGSKRTFNIDNVLAAVPAVESEFSKAI